MNTTKESHWQQIISEFQQSGQSGTAFCKTRDLVYANFCYWKKLLSVSQKKEFKKKTFQQKKLTDTLPDFMEILTVPQASTSSSSQEWQIVLKLGNGVELCLSQQ
jgi:hypothetical protein